MAEEYDVEKIRISRMLEEKPEMEKYEFYILHSYGKTKIIFLKLKLNSKLIFSSIALVTVTEHLQSAHTDLTRENKHCTLLN